MKKVGQVMNVDSGKNSLALQIRMSVLARVEKKGQGECFGEHVYVTQAYFDKYKHDQSDPTPACGKNQGDNCDKKCEWLENPYFNTYVINPSSMGEQASK